MKYEQYITTKNIILWILLVVLLIWFLIIIRRIIKIKDMQSWPSTNATVNHLNILADLDGRIIYLNYDNLSDYLSPNDEYMPMIQYTYFVGTSEYISNGYIYGPKQYYNSETIVEVTRNLAPNSTIQIIYNPKKYSESYVIKAKQSYSQLILSASFTLIVLLALIFYGNDLYNKSKETAKIMT